MVDADRLVAALYVPGGAGVEAVRRLFGDSAIQPDGGVDRDRLADIVFADAEARRRLEAAIHPLVRERFERIAAGVRGIIVLEGTLLVEAGMAESFDFLVTVEAEPETRLARAVARGMSESEARRRLTAQSDGDRRRAAADRVLRNDGDREDLERAVVELARELENLAAERTVPGGG